MYNTIIWSLGITLVIVIYYMYNEQKQIKENDDGIIDIDTDGKVKNKFKIDWGKYIQIVPGIFIAIFILILLLKVSIFFLPLILILAFFSPRR